MKNIMRRDKIVGIIPARYASTRFPGKPLVDINGKSMIQRVYIQASKALDNVFVATDDDRIYDAVKNFGGNVIMTSSEHQSGTDRCKEALKNIEKETGSQFDVVINIQGDEPFIDPNLIGTLADCFDNPKTEIATLVKKAVNFDELKDVNKPKVVVDANNYAIYFSRSIIPFLRQYPMEKWLDNHTYFLHIGLYAYKKETLDKITRLSPSSLELAESLEQLRWIENGFKIAVREVEYNSIGVDTPEDLEKLLKTIEI